MWSPLHGAEPLTSVVGAVKHTMISRMPFLNWRRSVSSLAIAGNPENDRRLSPWQEAVGHQVIPGTHMDICPNEATSASRSGASSCCFRSPCSAGSAGVASAIQGTVVAPEGVADDTVRRRPRSLPILPEPKATISHGRAACHGVRRTSGYPTKGHRTSRRSAFHTCGTAPSVRRHRPISRSCPPPARPDEYLRT
jgi:hypothetical protein